MLHVVLVEPEIPPSASHASASLQAPASISSSPWGFRSRKRRCAARAWITGTSVMCAHGRRLKLCAGIRETLVSCFLPRRQSGFTRMSSFSVAIISFSDARPRACQSLTANAKFCLTIPMRQEARSLNLATAAGIVLYGRLSGSFARSNLAMIAIELRGLTKTFRTYRKERGVRGALKGLFHRNMRRRARSMTPPFKSRKATLSAFSDRMAPENHHAQDAIGSALSNGGSGQRSRFCALGTQGRHEAPDQPSYGSKERLVADLPARESLELNRVIYEIPKPDFEQIVVLSPRCSMCASSST